MEFVLRCEIPFVLVVEVELLGGKHSFCFEGREISVALPKRCFCPHDNESNQEDEEVARCVAWKDERCITASIRKIFLTVALSQEDSIQVTEEMTFSEENSNKPFWENNTQEGFRKSGKVVSEIATRALEYWSRVVRWKTGFSYVGEPLKLSDAHPGWRYVASINPLRYIASFNDMIILRYYDKIPIEGWAEIQGTLSNFEQPPLWIDAYHGARRRLEMGDVRGA